MSTVSKYESIDDLYFTSGDIAFLCHTPELLKYTFDGIDGTYYACVNSKLYTHAGACGGHGLYLSQRDLLDIELMSEAVNINGVIHECRNLKVKEYNLCGKTKVHLILKDENILDIDLQTLVGGLRV